MSKILSQEEIDALLSTAFGGGPHGLVGGALPSDQWPEILQRYVGNVLNNTLQMYRLIANHSFNADLVPRLNMERKLRVFQAFEGKQATTPQMFYSGQPFADIRRRKFHEARTLEEAEKLAPAAIAQSVERGRGKVGETIESIRSLPTTSEKLLPSLENIEDVAELIRYKDYITKVYGEEAWNQIMQRAYTNKQLTELKNAVVMQQVARQAPEIRSRIDMFRQQYQR